MADKTRGKSKHQNLDSIMDFDDHELQATMQEFMEGEKEANSNIWNFATIAGIAMFFVAMVYLVQSLITVVGPDVSGLINIMPLIGGVLVTLVGFGFLVGERKKTKKKKSRKKRSTSRDYDFNFGGDEEEDYTLNNDLGSKRSTSNRSSSGKYDWHAFQQNKKLFKSRTDKKWAGVCGGLAKYFGISSTVVRLLFVVTFFAGSGTSLLVYIALAIALDKEPPEMADDYEF